MVLWDERLKNFRSIRRGLAKVVDEIEAGTFGSLYRGSSLETVVESIGTLSRSKTPLIKMEEETAGRLCRITAVLPQHLWRTPGVPEYRVQLLAMPVTTLLRHNDLDIAPN